MEIAQLKWVKEIHAAKSLSKASMRLNKAQSIVSRHLTAFEKECGGRIFHRNGRGVELTELGQKLLPQIELIIEAIDRLTESGTEPEELSGKVSISVSSALCECLVPALFAQIRRDHPAICLQIFEGYSNAIDFAFENGETDIAVYLSNGTSVSANQEPICRFDTFLIGPPGTLPSERKEILFSELGGLPLLLPSKPSLARHAIDDLAQRRGIGLCIIAEVNSPASMQALFNIGAGFLIAAVGEGSAAYSGHIGRQIKQGQLHAARIVDPDLKRTLVVGAPSSASHRVDVVRKATVRILRDVAQREDEPQPRLCKVVI